jgi:hypothetical protein
MRLASKLIGIAAVSAAVMATGVLPASADNGPVDARKYTDSGHDSGGHAWATVTFKSRTRVDYSKMYVNDTCPGDGFRVLGRAVALLRNGTKIHGAWHEDQGTCDSTMFGPYAGPLTSSSGDIMSAGIEVCIDKGDTNSCDTSKLLDSQYTSY